jgi:hypothetical protein
MQHPLTRIKKQHCRSIGLTPRASRIMMSGMLGRFKPHWQTDWSRFRWRKTFSPKPNCEFSGNFWPILFLCEID